MRIGGVSEVQTINFINNWTGTFRLAFDHDNNPDQFTHGEYLPRMGVTTIPYTSLSPLFRKVDGTDGGM